MRTFLIALVSGGVMSVITAAAILLTGATNAETAPAPSEAAAQPVLATASELRAEPAPLPPPAVDAAQPAAFDPAAIYERVAPAVVTIANEFGQGGSGFFVDRQGHILTNYHVVEGAQRIQVRTWQGELVRAELIGSDQANDLAVIRVNAAEATIALLDFSDPSAVRVGDSVAAIGAPHGYNHSLSTGIVSGLGRRVSPILPNGRTHYGIIQTDAALNPGNSGGVLVDAAGALLGVPFRIESPIRAFTGVALAIPVDTIQRVLPRMIAGEQIRHPILGVTLAEGLELAGVSEGSAADRAGLRSGDVLRSIGGITLTDFSDLIAALETLRVGQTARVEIQRGGTLQARQIELEPWPEPEERNDSAQSWSWCWPPGSECGDE